MENFKQLLLIGFALVLAACGTDDKRLDAGGDDDGEEEFVEINVAASSEGAIADSDVGTDIFLIDENTGTSWVNSGAFDNTVDLGQIEEIFRIELIRVSQSATYGEEPDILIEFSEDGITYYDSMITGTTLDAASRCNSFIRNNTTISCVMSYGEEMRYIRIYSPESISYQFTEIRAFARVPLP